MGRRRTDSADAWLPQRVYRGRSAFEYRHKNGACVRLAPLTATPTQVMEKFVDVTLDGDPDIGGKYAVRMPDYMQLYRVTRNRAKHRGMEFTLTPEEMQTMVARADGRCEITRLVFHTKRMANCRRAPYGPSMDRIDCKAGYTAENTRLVCIAVNLALNEFGYDVLLRLSRRIVAHA